LPEVIVRDARRINEAKGKFRLLYGDSNTFVRIPTSYALEIHKGQWKETEARVYFALASIIGVQKPYARAGWNIIALRAAGHVRTPKKPIPLLTRTQIDYQLKRLVERDLFACFTLNHGVRYWSFPNKCSREQVARYVMQKHLARKGALRESDGALAERIKAELLAAQP
jgi:hypothetical protein